MMCSQKRKHGNARLFLMLAMMYNRNVGQGGDVPGQLAAPSVFEWRSCMVGETVNIVLVRLFGIYPHYRKIRLQYIIQVHERLCPSFMSG